MCRYTCTYMYMYIPSATFQVLSLAYTSHVGVNLRSCMYMAKYKSMLIIVSSSTANVVVKVANVTKYSNDSLNFATYTVKCSYMHVYALI